MGHGLASVLRAEGADVTRGIHKTLNCANSQRAREPERRAQLQTDTAQAFHFLPGFQINQCIPLEENVA